MTDTIATTPTTTAAPLNAIQRAMALAKARKAAKEAAGIDTAPVTTEPEAKPTKAKKAKAEPAPKADSATDEAAIKRAEQLANREALKAKMAAERDARKAAAETKLAEIAAAKELKATERAAKKAEREVAKATKLAAKVPAHVKKAIAARAKLPALSEDAQKFHDDIVGLFSPAQVAAIAAHLALTGRFAAVATPVATTFEVGTVVKVTACAANPKAVGLQGRVTKSSKLRTFVDCGLTREAYCFTADLVAVVEEPEVVTNETATEEAAAE